MVSGRSRRSGTLASCCDTCSFIIVALLVPLLELPRTCCCALAGERQLLIRRARRWTTGESEEEMEKSSMDAP